jgi:hypothetical protein
MRTIKTFHGPIFALACMGLLAAVAPASAKKATKHVTSAHAVSQTTRTTATASRRNRLPLQSNPFAGDRQGRAPGDNGGCGQCGYIN